MANLFISPGKYISGYDNLLSFTDDIKKIGKKVLVVTDNTVYRVVDKLFDKMKKENIIFEIDYFTGECSLDEIERITKKIVNKDFDTVLGIGGGKIIDTAKAAGYRANVKMITLPTIAGTCAAWSSHSAVYTSNGIAYTYLGIEQNPDLVLIDKKILFESPVRYTISGIADTLAKWIETEASTRDLKEKFIETEIAIMIAKKSYDEILEFGIKAIDDIKNGSYSKEVDKIFEHIILSAGLVGGIGGEACRAVAAHSVNNGYTIITNRYKNNLHGEVVAFGIIVQMILSSVYYCDENYIKEAEKIIRFLKRIELKSELDKFKLFELNEDEKERVINRTIYKEETIWNLPYKVNYEMVKAAFLKAEELLFKEGC